MFCPAFEMLPRGIVCVRVAVIMYQTETAFDDIIFVFMNRVFRLYFEYSTIG